MKILVCAKVIKGEINPFDESALECALSLSRDVTVISMGPASSKPTLEVLTRLGAKVILISDSIYAGSDTLATSYILSKQIEKMDYDLILCGRQSIDGDTAQVGPMLSARLGIPIITNAISINCNDNKLCASTRLGDESSCMPCIVTLERSFVLRFPSIFSKMGEVSVVTNSELCCDEDKCGYKGSPTKVLEAFESQRGKRKCKYISFDELFPLINDLMKKADENIKEEYTGEKLKSVWAIGEEVIENARAIADEVILIPKLLPEEITQKILTEKPDVVLWNADLWGRKNAPIVAAMLETGLCADCTHLGVDGNDLIMYRPAQGGSITAKIKCTTKPQMATVRTKSESSDIIVSGGKGVADKFDKVIDLAKKLDAQIGASRGLVDMNKVPYEMQIGLTGKTVSPKVYIAIGISGAVHHTCAIEGAGTIVAVNPDKDARVFEYADYGIIESL